MSEALQAGSKVVVASSAIDPDEDEREEREAAALAAKEEEAKQEKKRMRSELEALISEKKCVRSYQPNISRDCVVSCI